MKNTNAFPVKLTNATISGTASPAECEVTVNSGSFSVAGTPTIPAGATQTVTIADALSMSADADTSCQGDDITISGITVNGESTS